jgi:predicted AlkP superfamily pyrophosphatase or phosphodiesterase
MFSLISTYSKNKIIFSALAVFLLCSAQAQGHAQAQSTTVIKTENGQKTKTKVIVMVWDGLRPDSISQIDTPNLFQLRKTGVSFADHHSTYPTFTMMNASSLAVGATPRKSGFYGNTFWTPASESVGKSALGEEYSLRDPIFTEDYAVLKNLNSYYDDDLILVQSLFKTAQKAGLVTAVIGKSGPTFLQDLSNGGYFLDENTALPLSFAHELQKAKIPLPANSANAFPAGVLKLEDKNGSPTQREGYITFAVTEYGETLYSRDATDSSQGAAEDTANKYMMKVFTSYILPKKTPDLSVIWFRTPDFVQHGYGVGSANYHKALKSMDARLGELRQALLEQRLDQDTNIIVVSDHGHSTVSGPTSLFPLLSINPATHVEKGISDAKIGKPDFFNGFSFSGDVRSADLLTYAGFKAFDGQGCLTSPMAGIKSDMSTVYTVKVDISGELCGTPNTKYMAISATLPNPVASFKVPKELPEHAVIVASNGGSDYFYVPDHDDKTVKAMVRFLQSREEFGPIFVDTRYGDLPGTFPLDMVNLENTRRRDHGQPDVVASFDWDSNQRVQGMLGIEYESFFGQRGMHGSFSPMDVHSTLLFNGPSFGSGQVVSHPSGNVDVAPTIAYLLGLSMAQAEGRILNEGLLKPESTEVVRVKQTILTPTKSATDLTFKSPADPTGKTPYLKHPKGIFSINLVIKDVVIGDKSYRYLDYAKAFRY